MPRFIASNVIAGKLTWAKVESSRIYSLYKDDAMKELNKRGYDIDKDGNCVPLKKCGDCVWMIIRKFRYCLILAISLFSLSAFFFTGF